MNAVAVMAQMMADNVEGLGMKAIAIMVQRYGVLPKEMWDLNSISDMGAGRGITFDKNFPRFMRKRISYNIINLTISEAAHMVTLPTTLRRLTILCDGYDYPLDLPETLQELNLGNYYNYNHPLVLPNALRKLVLSRLYNLQIAFPPGLLELELGAEYSQPLLLPQRLKRLSFHWESPFNHPLALPPSLVSLDFGSSYNQLTTLPVGIVEICVGPAFDHDLWLPPTLRKLGWYCNHSVQIPEGVSEIEFGEPLTQPVTLPSTLKEIIFYGETSPYPINLPAGLEELTWYPKEFDDLVLPEDLRKLTWVSGRATRLPSGLRELILQVDAPLVMPEGLVKVTFECWYEIHHNLPESVREVVWTGDINAFTHPTTLQHLIVKHHGYLQDLDLSTYTIHKLTIGNSQIRIEQWPQGLKELSFTVDCMSSPLRVPRGCRIVGEKRPSNVYLLVGASFIGGS